MPTAAERSVLHVLPHPGGGGETYVDLLDGMPGYRFSRVYLAPGPRPSAALARGVGNALTVGRGCDLVHAHGEVAAGLCLPLLAMRPSVVTLNGLHLVRRVSGLRRQAAVLNLRAVLRTVGRMICVSHHEYEELLRAVGCGAAKRSVVIRNAVRLPHAASEGERARTRKNLDIGDSEVVAIWIGSLDERKDPLAAVRAAEDAQVGLLVVGDGPLRPDVQRAAGLLARILGQRSDVPSLLDAADMYVLTSHREGLAFSLLEALAHGLPCVVTDLPENVEAVGNAGIVAPLGDHEGLVGALRRMARNDDERAILRVRARERARTSFALEIMRDRTRAVYEDVLAR